MVEMTEPEAELADPTVPPVEGKQPTVYGGLTQTSTEMSDEAKQQRKEDAEARAENPDAPVVREANPEVGGESF